jgi:CxxC motif-containing protein (DUF1111 family)
MYRPGPARRTRRWWSRPGLGCRCRACGPAISRFSTAGCRSSLRFKRVGAYTDLLLHDMGPDEADICSGAASPSDFRTQPLMGSQFLDMFMHDGFAETVERHGGEAARSWPS